MRNIIKQLRKQAGLRQEDMAQALGTSRQGAVRVSFSHMNTMEEVKRAVEAVEELARRL